MKKKFETNVAVDIPKTKLREPELPWKLSDEEAGQTSVTGGDLKEATSGASPLRTRAPFLILLLVTVFGITTYLVGNAVVENEKIRGNIARKENELSLVHMDLVKAVAEKDFVNKNSAQLEKKIGDLTAQKQLFASIIESLTKKGEEIDAPPAAPILTMTPAVSAPADAANAVAQPSGPTNAATGS